MNEINPNEFFERYELINSTSKYVPISNKSKKCRYCGQVHIGSNFRQITHLIPELLGENSILTFDECNDCNNLFSGYESHLATFVRPYLTFLGVKGKKKIPEFHSRTENDLESTRTILKHSESGTRQFIIQNKEDFKIDIQGKAAEINFRVPAFIPLNVYKALVKIGLSLLPKKYDKYNKDAFRWISKMEFQGEINSYPLLIAYTMNRKKCVKPFAELYRAKDFSTKTSLFIEHSLVLFFANQIFQIYLPLSKEVKQIDPTGKNFELIAYPSYAIDFRPEDSSKSLKLFELQQDKPVEFNHTMNISFDEYIQNANQKPIL